MEKIKKGFSLILIMVFLYQNIAFCTTEISLTLRAPSHFSQATEEFIKNKNDERLKQEVNLPSASIEELVAREGKRIIFSLPAKPEERYQLLIQEDFVSPGIFRNADEKPKIMIYVTTTLDDKEQTVYPVGIATGIYADEVINLDWISVLDYSSILEQIKSFRKQCREGTSLIGAMALYFMLGPKTEYSHQIKFLYAHFDSKLNISTDEEITRFFENAPIDLRRKGLGNAIAEFITSFAPIGSKIKFILANQKSVEALEAGETFYNTPIGSWFKALGYEVVQESKITSEKI